MGALLSEHDVLYSQSCSHLPRHLHRYTQYTHRQHSQFHLSSSELFKGVRSPSLVLSHGHRFTHFEALVPALVLAAPLSIISEYLSENMEISFFSQLCRHTQSANTAHGILSRHFLGITLVFKSCSKAELPELHHYLYSSTQSEPLQLFVGASST